MGAEKTFEEKVKRFLKSHGCWFIKYWGGGQFTKSGVPDILCCCDGFFIGIELKAPNGRISELQRMNLREIDKAKGFGILLYPKDFEVFKQFIHALKDGDAMKMTDAYKVLKGRWTDGTQ